jgi:hypothetical protein
MTLSIFVMMRAFDDIASRLARLEGHPLGPMPGPQLAGQVAGGGACATVTATVARIHLDPVMVL